MNQLQRTLLALLTGLLVATGAFARTLGDATDTTQVVTFRFLPGEDLLILKGNETELTRLSSLVDRYRAEISARRMPLRVDGYCASLPTPAENLRTAYLRANRVKSELITQKGLTEDDFITANYATAYRERRDVVVVTLRIPDDADNQTDTAVLSDSVILSEAKNLPTEDTAPEPAPEPSQEATPESRPMTNGDSSASGLRMTGEGEMPYTFALRTNLLYDAFLLPTLGIEWRINHDFGIRLDGSLSRWGGSTGNVQKIWMLSPEVRWYLLADRRFYLGASATYGEYNLYGYPLGNLLTDNTGYQGTLWSAGLSVGYQLRLCRHLAVDFNLGLGYTRSEYDSFTMTDGVRVSRERDRSKNFWGPTQAGISLVWTIGGNK